MSRVSGKLVQRNVLFMSMPLPRETGSVQEKPAKNANLLRCHSVWTADAAGAVGPRGYCHIHEGEELMMKSCTSCIKTRDQIHRGSVHVWFVCFARDSTFNPSNMADLDAGVWGSRRRSCVRNVAKRVISASPATSKLSLPMTPLLSKHGAPTMAVSAIPATGRRKHV
jgi:hypothetical protein